MKKIFSLLLICCMILSLAACSKKNTTSDINSIEEEFSNITKEEFIPIDLDVKDVVPKGATYYKQCTWDYAIKFLNLTLGEKLTEGDPLPEPKTGDVFVFDNLMYIYNAKMVDPLTGIKIDEKMNGWGVRWANTNAENGE